MKRSAMKRGTGMRRPTKRMRAFSKRRQRVNRDLRALSVQLLQEYPHCQIRLSGCYGRSSELHHVLSRGRSGRDTDLVDRANVRVVCRACHDWIESHRREAAELGLLRHAWDGAAV